MNPEVLKLLQHIDSTLTIIKWDFLILIFFLAFINMINSYRR